MAFRQWLRTIGPIDRTVARIRARQTRAAYEDFCVRFGAELGPGLAARVRHRMAEVRLAARANTPRVFYLGTDEFQDRSGFLQALSRYADVRVFTREDGAYGQNDPRPPEIRIPAITARLLALLESHAAEGWTPDVLMGQTWASVIDPDVLSVVRQRWGALIINISMDDRHQFVGPKLKNGQYGGVLPLVPHLDLALTAAPECVRWYESQGCPALYFPEASDPEIFRPMPTQPKVHDVSFVGARYGIREKLVTALRGAGIDVHAYGSGWEGGRLPVDAVPALFAQSRIILGVGTIGHCDDFYALKLRDFDAPMSGSCYLTHDNTDLHGLFDVGREIVTYRNIDDCLEKAKYLLAHEDERESIARAGHARAVGEHTWDLRFAGLFGLLKGLG
ncbi:CgeB family protein [Denitromonas iodatirespirans]|uniref:CgeB family protein n=1 Tax=Denitromonas iodatirespirans TaxID=2795389 RepID=UPI001BDDC477|nr:glycosyltransferase [Denitromonas iodatirespirans]